MKLRMLLSLLAATCTVLFAAPLAQGAPPRTSDVFQDIPVKGSTPTGGSLTGDFDVQRFVGQGNQLVAQGVLNGTLTEAGLTREVSNVPVALPLAMQQARATCRILHLVLGPLDLDLLGLRVQLNRVVLDITARRGPGRLLGNLLCGIAGLLDRSPIPLGALQNRLNSLNDVSNVVTGRPAPRNPVRESDVRGHSRHHSLLDEEQPPCRQRTGERCRPRCGRERHPEHHERTGVDSGRAAGRHVSDPASDARPARSRPARARDTPEPGRARHHGASGTRQAARQPALRDCASTRPATSAARARLAIAQSH